VSTARPHKKFWASHLPLTASGKIAHRELQELN
jgi:acyl-coenzyme A synthetase/AMP-(fatty) acid ligase